MTLPISLGGEGQGEATRLDGERLHIISPNPYAPGQPVTFGATLDGGTLTVEGRTQDSKKRDDGRFDVRMRLVNLSRGDRERLTAALAG